MQVSELQKLRQEQAKYMETSLAMTDGIMFPNCFARVC